jgi:hypothetical protein
MRATQQVEIDQLGNADTAPVGLRRRLRQPARVRTKAPKKARGRAPREIDVAWAAGLLDGEAWIGVSCTRQPGRKNPTYRPVVTVVQNCPQTLARLRWVLGESSHLHELTRRMAHNRQVYSLTYDGAHALRVLARVAPFLVRKRMEARVALSYRRRGWMGVHPGPKGYPPHVWKARRELCLKLKKLK